jgi:hypothetical protein
MPLLCSCYGAGLPITSFLTVYLVYVYPSWHGNLEQAFWVRASIVYWIEHAQHRFINRKMEDVAYLTNPIAGPCSEAVTSHI